MIRATLERRDGAPVVVRLAAGAHAEVLRTEVALLGDLAGLAVPRVVSVRDDGDSVEATTTWFPVARALAAPELAAAADVLATAHDRGRCHGALDRASLRAGPGGGIVVDGWTGTGTPAGDVAALGRLLAGGLDERSIDPSTRARLRALAERAVAPDDSARPSMRTLADGLGPEPPRPSVPRRRPDARSHRRQPPAVLVLGTAVVVVATTLAATTALLTPARPAPTGPRPATSRPAVTIEGVRWRVGGPGDRAVAGDWDCDGDREPAVLRPDGSVWAWAGLGGEPALVGIADAADGAELATGTGAGGCDRPVVRDRAGAEVALSPPARGAGPPRSPAAGPGG
ncbi:MAG: hypothetical protein AB7V15_01470 [Acidimicrobiia bacterium]